jgi:hypothetical protein
VAERYDGRGTTKADYGKKRKDRIMKNGMM